jgi:hypothetical protein
MASSTRSALAWLARLNREGLLAHSRSGATLELRYRGDVRDRVHQMVEKESACCAFLTFAVIDLPDGVRVTITAPEGAGDSIDLLLQPFVGR